MKTINGRKTRAIGASGLFEEMAIDNFAGGGGASRGIEAAIGRAVDVAINHDAHSVEMHQLNHPHTRHLQEDVFQVDPVEVTGGRPVGVAWFSPDCRHFSRAKGGKPVSKKIRGLAWIAVKWAKLVRPRIIFLENVREFQDWGPLTPDNYPCPKRKGQTFKRFVTMVRNLGYAVDCRILNAADFGAPTHRKRFFLIARCDGQPICWPEPTHGPGRQHPYRTAAECIDWSIPCPSIFLSKEEARRIGVIRPLAEKTMRRIALGVKKYVLDNPKPFIVRCAHGETSANGKRWGRGAHSIEEPLPTQTATKDYALVAPSLVEVANSNWSNGHRAADAPMPTITAQPKGGSWAVSAAHLAKFRGESKGADLNEPMPTITAGAGSKRPAGAAHAMGIVAANLLKNNHGSHGVSVEDPLHTITTGGRHGVVSSFLSKFYGTNVGSDAMDPMPTVTATGNHIAEVRAFLMRYYSSGGQVGQVDAPAPTITTKDRLGVVTVDQQAFQIVDIGLRMLSPRELLRAQFGQYAEGYILTGTKSQQVARIGNSVPPELAEAVVRANVTAKAEVAA